jgi:hypothetical protein
MIPTDLDDRLRRAAAGIPAPAAAPLVRRIVAAAGPVPRSSPAAHRWPGPWVPLAAAVVIAVAMVLAVDRPTADAVALPMATTTTAEDPLQMEIDALRRDLGTAGGALGDLVAWERFAPGLDGIRAPDTRDR